MALNAMARGSTGGGMVSDVSAGAPTIAAGAVVTADYLPWARATARSFAEHHPDTRFVVLVVDEPDSRALRHDDPFELRTPAQVGISGGELGWMQLIYDGLEICCALKPSLLRYLLSDADVALYLDSDLLICDSLHDVALRAAEVGLVVSPHSLQPRRYEAQLPNDDSLLEVGQFNAGFVAVGRAGLPFVDWWADKLARECTSWDPTVPLRFLDQRWLDLVVNYFPCEVDRDPGAGVARWNLFQRRLELTGDRYVVDGRPLRFFHFSSFDPGDPSTVSRVAPPHESTDLNGAPALRRLVTEYTERLISAGWQPRAASRPVPERAGIRLTRPVRAAVRAALIESERVGVAPPAGPGDPDTLLAWLRSPVGRGPLNWYMWGLWQSQAGLRHAFPQVPGADEQRLVSWAATEGQSRQLVPSGLAGPARPTTLDDARGFVALVSAGELLEDPTLLTGVSERFSARDDVSFLIHAPGWNADALMGALPRVLAAVGLDRADAPDLLALLDAAGPAAVAGLVHAVLSRRTSPALADLPHACDAASLRRLADVAVSAGKLAA